MSVASFRAKFFNRDLLISKKISNNIALFLFNRFQTTPIKLSELMGFLTVSVVRDSKSNK
jgi:hypothetical protein